jgi:hypothetical protein
MRPQTLVRNFSFDTHTRENEWSFNLTDYTETLANTWRAVGAVAGSEASMFVDPPVNGIWQPGGNPLNLRRADIPLISTSNIISAEINWNASLWFETYVENNHASTPGNYTPGVVPWAAGMTWYDFGLSDFILDGTDIAAGALRTIAAGESTRYLRRAPRTGTKIMTDPSGTGTDMQVFRLGMVPNDRVVRVYFGAGCTQPSKTWTGDAATLLERHRYYLSGGAQLVIRYT